MTEKKTPALEMFFAGADGVHVFRSYDDVGPCELCGAIKDRRPYGPNRERICYACGQKDIDGTMAQTVKAILGTQT